MDSTLLAGIIGGACTILAVIITPIAQNYLDRKIYLPINKDRRKILHGTWRGIVKQELSDSTYKEFSVDLSFEIMGKKVVGKGIINQDKVSQVNLDGFFRNDRFLKMDYQNVDINVIQFGCFVFHLSEESSELTGRFLGYGPISKAIIHGSCVFKKI